MFDLSQKLTDIENLLIWAFQAEKASIHDVSGLDATAGYPQDSCERVYQICYVQGGYIGGTSPGGRELRHDTATDADTVASVVRDLYPAEVRARVISHAKAANRPDWRPYANHRFEPVDWIRTGRTTRIGRPEKSPYQGTPQGWPAQMWQWDGEAKKSRRAPVPEWVPTREIDTPAFVAMLRRAYCEWWDALVAIREALPGLYDWRLSEHMPPRKPWR